jgi:hypothetical protein
MNASEHIRHITKTLADQNQITVAQCVDIISALVTPFAEHGNGLLGDIPLREPEHFVEVNNMIHRLLAILDRRRVRALNPQQRAEHDAELREYRNENRRGRARRTN